MRARAGGIHHHHHHHHHTPAQTHLEAPAGAQLRVGHRERVRLRLGRVGVAHDRVIQDVAGQGFVGGGGGREQARGLRVLILRRCNHARGTG